MQRVAGTAGAVRAYSEAGLSVRWGGHAEELRRRRGDAVGVKAGASLIDRFQVNVGTVPGRPVCRAAGSGGGQVRCRPMAVGWGGGPVVVRARERRAHGEGDQQVSREDTGMPGGRR